MTRIEIIANLSVQAELIDALEDLGEDFSYTLIPVVHGRSRGRYRLGTATWPEENFILIAYVEDSSAQAALEKTEEVRKRFPEEGISFFTVPAH